MSFFRTFLIWILAISLPVDALASVSMSNCKDMQQATVEMDHEMPGMDHGVSSHDHAAMMAMADEAVSDDAGMHDHHAMASGSAADSPEKAKSTGCQCGCKCSGNCAVSCASMLVAMTVERESVSVSAFSMPSANAPRSQAHAAYRFDPLRPPSAVAL